MREEANMYEQQTMERPPMRPYCRLSDADMAKAVIGELERAALQYTRAVMETESPLIRQTLEHLLHNTLRDHQRLKQILAGSHSQREDRSFVPAEYVNRQMQRLNEAGFHLQQFVQHYLSGNVQAAQTYDTVYRGPGTVSEPGPGRDEQQPIRAAQGAQHVTPEAERGARAPVYHTPSESMYQSAAPASDFNSTGSRQMNSHATGAASTGQHNVDQLDGGRTKTNKAGPLYQ
jgi:hypothetical protein